MSFKARILLLAIATTFPPAAPALRQVPAPVAAPTDAQHPESNPQPPAELQTSREVNWQAIELGPERALSMEPIELPGQQRIALTRLLKTQRAVRRTPRRQASPPLESGVYRAILLPAGQPDLVVATDSPAGEDGRWFLADLGPQAHLMAKLTASILWVQPATANGLNDLVILRFVRKLPTLAYLRYNGRDYVELGTHLVLPCPIVPGFYHSDFCLPNGRALQVPQPAARPVVNDARPPMASFPR
jgi:hypothetical protein